MHTALKTSAACTACSRYVFQPVVNFNRLLVAELNTTPLPSRHPKCWDLMHMGQTSHVHEPVDIFSYLLNLYPVLKTGRQRQQ